MNNRQGMNSRLPYNERAFSPQRMMNSNNFPSSNMNQQSAFGNSSSGFQQPFYQPQSDMGRNSNFLGNQRNQSDLDGWFRSGTDSGRSNQRNVNSQDFQSGFSGFSTNSNQNYLGPAFSQPSNFGGNFPTSSFASDFIPLNSNQRFQPSSSSSNRQSGSVFGPAFDQPRSNVGSTNQSRSNNFQRSSGQISSGDRGLGSREQRRGTRGTEQIQRRNTGSTPQKSRQEPGNSRGAPKQNLESSKPKPKNLGQKILEVKPASTSTVKERYPDIGEPKIKPKFADVFDLVKKTDSGASIYSCKICKLGCIPDNNVAAHLSGKKHRYNLKLVENYLPGNTKYQKEKHFREVVNEKLHNHKPMFELIISSVTQPLVALEYIIEILDSKAKEQLYVCVLCDKRCDPRTIGVHLRSQTHKINYLTKHFLPIITRLQSYRRFTEDLEYRQEALLKICSRIESKFGRTSAFLYEGQDFTLTKAEIFDNINMKKHVTIDDIPSAEEFLLEGIELSNPKWESENEPKPKKEPLEIPNSVRRKRKVPENVLEEYKTAVEYAKSTMESKLREYERDPDSHPKYKAEWELFWNQKVDEMSKRGEDTTTHNFHEEWCQFFVKRMRELHEEEIKWKIDQIRKNLGLSHEDIEASGKPDAKRTRHDSQASAEARDELLSDRKGRFYVSDNDDDSFDEDYREFGPRIPKDVLHVKEKKIFSKFLDAVGIDETSRPKPKPILFEKPEPVDRTMPEISRSTSNEPTTLITTLRLLTSLEQELGLLAQKVLDLLSKSIAFEREHSKPSDELLFETENLILVETVKEKIIGMQMAHLITNNKTKAVEKAISEITKLIQQHEVMINIKKTLKEMGKDEASPEEIQMLKSMFMKKKDDKGKDFGNIDDDSSDVAKRRRRRGAKRSNKEESWSEMPK